MRISSTVTLLVVSALCAHAGEPSAFSVAAQGEALFGFSTHGDNTRELNTAVSFEYAFGGGWAVSAEGEFTLPGGAALSEFWGAYTVNDAARFALGYLRVPIGMANYNDTPTQFFGVWAPYGECTMMPGGWHETGLSYSGTAALGTDASIAWEAMALAETEGEEFGVDYRRFAGAARVDVLPLEGMRFSLSGYFSRRTVGAFDAEVQRGGLLVRANAAIGGKDHTYGAEAGFDMLTLARRTTPMQLFIFARYDGGDIADMRHNQWTAGLNFFPRPDMVVKAQYSKEQVAVALGFAI